MKKYYLSLICVGVIIGCVGAAAGLSLMLSKTKAPDKGNRQIRIAEQDIDMPTDPDIVTQPEPAQTPEPQRIKPSTRMVFETFYQTDNQTKIIDGEPPYFLLDLSQNKVQDYYPDWEIVEFNEQTVKLYRTVATEPESLYVLGVKDNFVAIYQKSDNGSVRLKEVTATPISALSQDEQSKLISGIKIQNENQLAQMLEDYGS